MGISTHTSLSGNLNATNDSLEMLKSFYCPSCPAKFIEMSELKAHLSQRHGDQMPFCCQLCGRGYRSRKGLWHHMNVHEGRMSMCPICYRTITQKTNFKKHLRNVHKSDQCDRCMKVFDLEQFNIHVSTCCITVQ